MSRIRYIFAVELFSPPQGFHGLAQTVQLGLEKSKSLAHLFFRVRYDGRASLDFIENFLHSTEKKQ